MVRGGAIAALACLLGCAGLGAAGQKVSAYPKFGYEDAAAHELEPHRHNVPLKGVQFGLNQLRLTLMVSPEGEVERADAAGDRDDLKFWPQLQGEVRGWKFKPFEVQGKAVTAEVEEYVDLVPPERFPQTHVAAPELRPDSVVQIRLDRSGCYGSCPSYAVTVSTASTVFDGRNFVVAAGEHRDAMNAGALRKLAARFVAADFYSMDASYRARVTDNPTYELSISIDGASKSVEDYVGSWVGMPAVITELEDAVDEVARTGRWINGDDGLVPALEAEGFDFTSEPAREMMKAAAQRGRTATVREFVQAGVPAGALN